MTIDDIFDFDQEKNIFKLNHSTEKNLPLIFALFIGLNGVFDFLELAIVEGAFLTDFLIQGKGFSNTVLALDSIELCLPEIV